MITINTGTEELLCRIQDRIGVITLNKPEKKNSLGDVLTPALRQSLLVLEEDSRVNCVMITGSGNAFCSGGDVGGMRGITDDRKKSKDAIEGKHLQLKQAKIDALVEKQITLTQRIYELSKVTIAALPGAAAGAGLSIALACDLRVASENAFVTTAFRNIGLSGDYGGSWFLPRIIGLGRAKQLYYTGESVTADAALAMGLFNKVYAEDSFPEDALAYARDIANGPRAALAKMKINLQAGLELKLAQSLYLEAKHTIESFASEESAEAIRAFTEKRPPNFHS